MKFHVFIGRELIIKGRILEDNPKGFSGLVLLANGIETVDFNLTGGWRKKGGQHFDGSGFACTVWPQESENFTSSYVKRDIIDRQKIPKILDKAFYFNDIVICHNQKLYPTAIGCFKCQVCRQIIFSAIFQPEEYNMSSI
jgi:hypothetical protein